MTPAIVIKEVAHTEEAGMQISELLFSRKLPSCNTLDSDSPVFLHLFWHTTKSDNAVVYDYMKHGVLPTQS